MTAAPAPIVVVARWQVRSGALGDVLSHVAELRQASLAEPGCLGYEVFQSADASGTLLLLEHYRDDDALEAHRHSAHYRAWVVDRILPLLAVRVVEVLRPRDAA
ncbi:putative quinol monooxygenase [Aquincola sp. MAHUQ-54]|uniref:Quinol monooxygenase n=1 Tax=Aquincola agrisoli TaxID=3119538 RepID=A0AAW9PZF5_9BURK